jgi:serine/threonine protein kinase
LTEAMDTVAKAAHGDPVGEVVVLRHGGRYKPEIRIEQLNGSRVTVKDFAPCGRWFRWLIARWLVVRECRAYRAAAGIDGVPRLIDRLGPYALALEYVDGRPCDELPRDQLPGDFWEQLSRIVAQLHDHGMAHGDLKTLDNVLIGHDGCVHLTDFSSAVISPASLLHRLVFPFMRDDDRRAIIKIKLELAPDCVTEQESRFLRDRPLVERLFRWVRVPLRRLAKRLGGPAAERARDRAHGPSHPGQPGG